jgi:hypothetical protein
MAKEIAPTGKVLTSVLTQYKALIASNQKAIREFITTNSKVNSRDLLATLTEGKKSGAISAIRPAYALYFAFAGEVLATAWSKDVEVSALMAEVAVCQRSAGADVARQILSESTSFAQFSKFTRDAEQLKKSKKAGAGAGRKSSKKGAKVGAEVMAGELVIPETVTESVTAGMVIRFALNRLESLDTLTLSADEIILAEKLAKKVGAIAKVAKSANHPSVKAKTLV